MVTWSIARIALGKKHFNDTALSDPAANKGEKVSCNTCHLLDKYGIDGHDRSLGYGREGTGICPHSL